MSLSVSRLEHVYLSVCDLDRTLSFYRRLLPDWVIRWEGRHGDARWIHFGPPGGGQSGYLSLAEEPAGSPFEAYARLGPQHIGFSHPDVDQLVATVAPAIEPTDRVDNGAYRRAHFADPDGIEVELVQALGQRP